MTEDKSKFDTLKVIDSEGSHLGYSAEDVRRMTSTTGSTPPNSAVRFSRTTDERALRQNGPKQTGSR